MNFIVSGLQTYAKIKAYVTLIIFLFFYFISLWFTYRVYAKKYVKTTGTISYQRKNGSKYVDCKNLPHPLCKHYIEYNADKSYKMPMNFSNVKTKLGKTTVFYSKKNKSSHIVSPYNPIYVPYMFNVIFILAIILTLIYIHIISKYKTIGAIFGGMEVSSDVSNLIQ